MLDLTDLSDAALSHHVFDDEFLYGLRDSETLLEVLDHEFIYSEAQKQVLFSDLHLKP